MAADRFDEGNQGEAGVVRVHRPGQGAGGELEVMVRLVGGEDGSAMIAHGEALAGANNARPIPRQDNRGRRIRVGQRSGRHRGGRGERG